MLDNLDLSMRANHVFFALLTAILAVLGVMLAITGDTFYLRLATEALILGGLALSVDILLGFGGLLSLGQALYFGIGAYTSALVLREVPSFWVAINCCHPLARISASTRQSLTPIHWANGCDPAVSSRRLPAMSISFWVGTNCLTTDCPLGFSN